MKSFLFSLERMRNYKEQVLDKEKNTLRHLQLKKNEIERQISNVETYRELKLIEFQKKQSAGIKAIELSAHQFYMENTRLQLEDLRVSLKKAADNVEFQLKIVVKASQEISGLDKLEEKQLEEYQYTVTKENELQISELVSASLIRKQQNA